MKSITAFCILNVSLLLAGCGAAPPGNDGTAGNVAALETKIGALESQIATLTSKADATAARDSDLTLKARIISNQVFLSPLDRFFGSPEFWENTYDSGQADCAKRCISTLQTENAACGNNANPPQCRQDAVNKASNCQTQCSKNNPPPF